MTDREARLEKALRQIVRLLGQRYGGGGIYEEVKHMADPALAEQPGETGLPKEGAATVCHICGGPHSPSRHADYCRRCDHQRSVHVGGLVCTGVTGEHLDRACDCKAFVEPASEQPAPQAPPELDAATTEGREATLKDGVAPARFCEAVIEYGPVGGGVCGFTCSLPSGPHDWHVAHSDEDLSVEHFRWRVTPPLPAEQQSRSPAALVTELSEEGREP